MKAIELNHSRIRDRTLITELSGLAQKNGRIDHSVSGHDDTVIGFLLGAFFIFFGNNLSYYAINNRMFLNEINYSGERVDKEEKARQEQLLKEVIELRKEIKRVSMSGVLSEPLERRLHHLESLIDNGIVDTTPITSEQATKAMPKYTKPVDLVKMANLYYR